MADTQVLGTCVFGRAGSSPASRTQLKITPNGGCHLLRTLCTYDSHQERLALPIMRQYRFYEFAHLSQVQAQAQPG